MKKYKFIGVLLLLTAIILSPIQFAQAKSFFYTNSSNVKVHIPMVVPAIPIGATAKCKDGSYSFSQHGRGTCSGHRGVATRL
jgi:hypothetical protein